MTGASTKRRHKHKTAPPRALPGLASEVMREMLKPPGQEDYDAAYRRAAGRAPAEKDAEIARLRAAMAHAIDECEHEALCAGSSITRNNMRRIASRLKAALEKK